MHRRHSLTLLAGVATGGCLSVDVPNQSGVRRGVASFAQRGHPYESDVLTVAVDADLENHPKLGAAIETATAYWETHAPRFADFPVSYSIEPDAEAPDVEVRAIEAIDHCGKHSGGAIAGCAPRVTTETVRPEVATIRIETGLQEPFLTRILKHEFGHTLGLGHDDEPQHIMSSTPKTWVPQYEHRKQIVDEYADAVEQYNTAIEAYNDGTEQFDEDSFTTSITHYEASTAAIEATQEALDHVILAGEEIGAASVVDNAEESKATISALGTSAQYLIEAATAYEDGDPIQGKRQQQRHAESYESFREGTFYPSSTIIRLLGMPDSSP